MATQDTQDRPFETTPRRVTATSTVLAEPPPTARSEPVAEKRSDFVTRAWSESERVTALETYRLLDVDTEPAFEDLVRVAAKVLDVPIAAINLIASDRQWSLAEIGLGTREMGRELSFCARAILEAGGLSVADTTQDPNFRDHPLVTAGPQLRFYANEVLSSREGLPLGTFCVADTRPRPGGLSAEHRFILRTLARQVGDQLELRRSLAERDVALAEQARVVDVQRADGTFLRGVLAASNDCIKVLDLEGNIIFMSDAGRRVHEAEELTVVTNCPWPNHWKGEGLRRMQAAIRTAVGGGTGHFQSVADGPDGAPRWWDVQVTPIFGADRRPERLLSVARDITETRRAEEALREAQSLNTLILHSSNDCIVVLDLYGHTQFVTPGGIAAMEITDVDSIIGLSWLRVWLGSDHDLACAAVAEARAGRVGRFQGFCKTHKGTPKWWDVVVSPLPGPDGLPERLVSVGRDVTKRKLAEQRLARSEERLNLALGASGMVGIWDWDLKTDLIFADANLARIYGLDPAASARGAPPGEYSKNFHSGDTALFEAELERVFAGAGEFSVEFRVLQPGGAERWVLARGRLVRDEAGVPTRLPGAAIDITDRKRAEAALQEANGDLERRVAAALAEREAIGEALRQSQKMEAVGQLTGGLAHDFNNLLASISGSLEMLHARLSQGRLEEFDRYIEAAQGAARRAASLTHRLLAFSRRQTLDPRPTDVNRLVEGMQELINRTAGPQITVEVVLADGLWSTLVDANQLENALLNLCINARDAMPGAGRLTITTANHWIEGVKLRDGDVPPGPYVALCVSDTGSGMTPEIMQRAFDPFFTTKPLGMGTGLGLSMVYGFVRQSGGQVAITSEVGHGTSLCLHLPRHLGEAGETAPVAEPGAATSAPSGATVLLVDDEPTLRSLIAEVLEELGYHVIEAADGASGLKVVRSNVLIDLLVTDVGLPGGMNGRQLADAARELRNGLKVLFITGYAESVAVGGADLEPGMQVLTKPFPMQTLAGCVRKMIAATA